METHLVGIKMPVNLHLSFQKTFQSWWIIIDPRRINGLVGGGGWGTRIKWPILHWKSHHLGEEGRRYTSMTTVCGAGLFKQESANSVYPTSRFATPQLSERKHTCAGKKGIMEAVPKLIKSKPILCTSKKLRFGLPGIRAPSQDGQSPFISFSVQNNRIGPWKNKERFTPVGVQEVLALRPVS